MQYVDLGDGSFGNVLQTDDPSLWLDKEQWPGAKLLTKAEGQRRRKAYCKEQLLKLLKPGDTVYCVLRHVSRSGMRRHIDLFVFKPNERGECDKLYLSQFAADLMGWPMATEGIKVDGCGMDMGFHTVYTLGYYLWPKGTDKPHGTRNGEPDSKGGYALKHAWL